MGLPVAVAETLPPSFVDSRPPRDSRGDGRGNACIDGLSMTTSWWYTDSHRCLERWLPAAAKAIPSRCGPRRACPRPTRPPRPRRAGRGSGGRWRASSAAGTTVNCSVAGSKRTIALAAEVAQPDDVAVVHVHGVGLRRCARQLPLAPAAVARVVPAELAGVPLAHPDAARRVDQTRRAPWPAVGGSITVACAGLGVDARDVAAGQRGVVDRARPGWR